MLRFPPAVAIQPAGASDPNLSLRGWPERAALTSAIEISELAGDPKASMHVSAQAGFIGDGVQLHLAEAFNG